MTLAAEPEPARRRVLFAAGDPGGANALLPVVAEVARRGAPLLVLDHGRLGHEAPGDAPRLPVPERGADLRALLRGQAVGTVCFGTSLADPLPLALARAVQENGGSCVAVLDNWMNYRRRLTTDGGAVLVPRAYAVMDRQARIEAEADGVPPEVIAVTGHPALATLGPQAEAEDWRGGKRRELGLGLGGRQLVAFISEPVERDQGADAGSPTWRGYTEKTVLAVLCDALQAMADRAAMLIVPHPRDDVGEVADLWERCRGRLAGRVLQGLPGRQAMLCADRVAGMASILLYEAWLLGRPTLSLQPGLVRADLTSLACRDGLVFVDRADEAAAAIGRWWRLAPASPPPDLALHRQAAANVADLVLDITQ